MPGEFLRNEYDRCFEQLRFYDQRHADMLKYVFTLGSSVATAQFAIYKFTNGPTDGFFSAQAFLGGIVFVATLLLYVSMLQNRVYFVQTAKQINSIRGYLLSKEAPEFDNQMYTTTNISVVKPSSVHTFQMVGAALTSSLYAAVMSFGVASMSPSGSPWCPSAITLVVVLVAEVWGGYAYLSSKNDKTADQAVHHQN